MDRKKIFIIIATILIGIISGTAYWFFLKKAPALPPSGGLFPGESTGTKPGQVPPAGTGEGELTTPPVGALPRLYELHKSPVAGVGFMEAGNSPYISTSVRYIERGLGHIFETPLSTYAESKISSDTYPSISEALWGNNGASVVIRFIKDQAGAVIQTEVLNLKALTPSSDQNTSSGNSSPFKTEIAPLSDNIPFLSTSEDGADQIFYLENGPDASLGSVSTFNATSFSSIFSSSFTEWLPQFPNQNLITLTTKPSATVPGYLYFLDEKTGVVTKVLGGINGLTTLTSHDGRLVLYSETTGKTVHLSVFNTQTKESHSLNIQTLPEKCSWGRQSVSIVYCAVPQSIPPGDYPDQWYQGLVSFPDSLWKIDTETLVKNKIMSPEDFGFSSFDIINPVLSLDENYLIFMNKLSGTPWVFRIPEVAPESPVVAAPSVTTPSTAAPSMDYATPPDKSTFPTSTSTLPPSVVSPGMVKIK